jgi:hypothetical protein
MAQRSRSQRPARTGSESSMGVRAQTLVDALAEKGTPGLILLGIIFVVVWSPVWPLGYKLFDFLGKAKDFSGSSGLAPVGISGLVGALLVGYIFMAYRLSTGITQTIIPTIRAEAEAATLMSQALGGRIITASGTWQTLAIDLQGAQTRARQIMAALVERAKSVLGYDYAENIRSNIFTLNLDGKLKILGNFHVHMKDRTPGDKELQISIPYGYLTTGMAFKYFWPVLSVKDASGNWPYSFVSSDAAHKSLLEAEVQKAHPNLKWVISMPIPHRVQPFKMACGTLNLDGLEKTPEGNQLFGLLADLSTAAALIGVLNRGTGFLDGLCAKPGEPSDREKELLRNYLISPEQFDPGSCPEPSREFVQALGAIKGLEFFGRISETEIASWLRDQLRS